MKTQIEQEFNKIVTDFINAEGRETYEQLISAELNNAILEFHSYAFESGQNLTGVTDVEKRIHARHSTAKGHGLLPEYKKDFDFLNNAVGDITRTLEQMNIMEITLSRLSGYYTDSTLDYRTSKDKQAEMERHAEKIERVEKMIGAFSTQMISVRECGEILIGAWLGEIDKNVLSLKGAEADKEQLYAYLEAKGYENPQSLTDKIKSAPLPIESQAYMDIQSVDPEFGKEFIKAKNSERAFGTLSDVQLMIAAQNFDIMTGFYFDDKKKQELKKQGRDILDFVFVNGRSVNEIYADKYADKPYYLAVERMKCEFLADALEGKQVDIYLPDHPKKMLPITIQSQLPEIKVTLVPEAFSENERKQLIQESLARLANRSEKEVSEKIMRMANDTPPEREILKPVEKSKVIEYNPTFPNKTQHDTYLNMRILEGTLDKQDNLAAFSSQFNTFAAALGYPKASLSGILKTAGIHKRTDLFYIDGMPAEEYVENLYPKKRLIFQ